MHWLCWLLSELYEGEPMAAGLDRYRRLTLPASRVPTRGAPRLGRHELYFLRQPAEPASQLSGAKAGASSAAASERRAMQHPAIRDGAVGRNGADRLHRLGTWLAAAIELQLGVPAPSAPDRAGG